MINDEKHVATIFNDCFVNVGDTINSNITSNKNPISYMTSISNSITVPEYTQSDVESASCTTIYKTFNTFDKLSNLYPAILQLHIKNENVHLLRIKVHLLLEHQVL